MFFVNVNVFLKINVSFEKNVESYNFVAVKHFTWWGVYKVIDLFLNI